MRSYQVPINPNFIGRSREQQRIEEVVEQPGAKIIIVYGRRRIGKTELLEQTLRQRNLLKFEGQERMDQKAQMQFVMRQLATYANKPELAKIHVADWVDVFKTIAEYTQEGTWTIYLEELQWLADYKDDLVSALKYVWDNFFRRNSKIVLILCGSSPAFMINHVVKSKALHNRSHYEIPLRELNLISTSQMLSMRSQQEVLDIFLTLGGMPEYLLRFKNKQSAYITLCKESFTEGAFFLVEPERIFSSSLGSNKHYREIIDYLSRQKFATRAQIAKAIGIHSGGGLSELLNDLSICGFIEKYAPYNLGSDSNIARYAIVDNYLQFYFKFIKPNQKDIIQGHYNQNPTNALNLNAYQQWLGYAFERFCRKYHRVIAAILGFSAVKYRSGAFYNRKASTEMKGYQMDLVFDRDDKVITLCEVKYSKSKISANVINEFESKLALLPNQSKKTVQKVLIANQPPSESLVKQAYFDRFIGLDELFQSVFWGM